MAQTLENPFLRRLIVTAVKQETDDVKTFQLIPEDGKPLPYKSGQFLTFLFSEHGREDRRSYSISSASGHNEALTVTVKRVPNGSFSRWFFDRVKRNDVLQTIGASGFFTLPENIEAHRQLFFFAAGVGITPVISIIKTALCDHIHLQIVLVYSNRSIAETVFYGELEQLKASFPERFKIEYIFSTAKDLERAHLNKWLLPALYQEHSDGELDKQLFYICGPFAYRRMVIMSLEELNIPAAKIKKEDFDVSKPKLRLMPQDTGSHQVRVQVRGKQYSFEVNYPDSILQASRKAQVAILPFSCETGQCGTCVAQCLSGNVWMSYNEVLTDDEIASGKVLTCVGHPQKGDVVLSFDADGQLVSR
ncbi:ferredoxin--NADP reductase [Taibaiella soli]|uniref:Oxidoreductase n=1 Tax=Taibaiella soli TaxID=1649169 RepID=A0A2W2AF63_9BACT|nr:ferredoxin--NADP reductase [Taibaiella soli]PZF74115.1 hypothetical protein DN068_03625 [Taibaiella soli]